MRCDLAALAALALASPRASADIRALVAADGYVATASGVSGEAAADVAWSAHVESREPERDAVLDWVERESLIGGTPRRELHELSYVDRRFSGLELTIGRFRVPGGFWLIADGGGIALRTDTVVAGVFAGSRSFTNGRSETLLTRSPHPLPLVGAAIALRGAVQAAASYTYTADLVPLYRGDGMTATIREPEQFVDAELATAIGAHGLVTGGASLGNRYLVSYPTSEARIADNPALATRWFGAQSAYVLVDERLGDWRFDGSVSALRTKLAQAADPGLAAINGSFVDAALRASWRHARSWRVDGRYRVRLRGDQGLAQRAELFVRWHGVLDVQARVGLDARRAVTPAGSTRQRTLLYRASVGRKTQSTDIAIGIAAVAALGDELSAGPAEDAGDQRAPYTLEARSYGFVHAFATRGAWFGGVDGELDLRGDGMRALLQIGFSR